MRAINTNTGGGNAGEPASYLEGSDGAETNVLAAGVGAELDLSGVVVTDAVGITIDGDTSRIVFDTAGEYWLRIGFQAYVETGPDGPAAFTTNLSSADAGITGPSALQTTATLTDSSTGTYELVFEGLVSADTDGLGFNLTSQWNGAEDANIAKLDISTFKITSAAQGDPGEPGADAIATASYAYLRSSSGDATTAIDFNGFTNLTKAGADIVLEMDTTQVTLTAGVYYATVHVLGATGLSDTEIVQIKAMFTGVTSGVQNLNFRSFPVRASDSSFDLDLMFTVTADQTGHFALSATESGDLTNVSCRMGLTKFGSFPA